MYPFQKGVLFSSMSLIVGLYKVVNEKFGMQYIRTRKLNQDCLENFFGYIRQMQGTYDHPNTVKFKYRLRSLLLGKEAKLISRYTNCTEDGTNGYAGVSVSAGNENRGTSKAYNAEELSHELFITSVCVKDGFWCGRRE